MRTRDEYRSQFKKYNVVTKLAHKSTQGSKKKKKNYADLNFFILNSFKNQLHNRQVLIIVLSKERWCMDISKQSSLRGPPRR